MPRLASPFRNAGTSRRPASVVLPLVVLAWAAEGCTTRPVTPPPAQMGGMGPVLSVERFLQATNSRDFDAMAQLFGTSEGSLAEDPRGASRQDVELRMAAIAEILRHEDYAIVSESQQPGRVARANRVGVNITQGGQVIRDVAFVVVQATGGRWLVESIDLEKVTGS